MNNEDFFRTKTAYENWKSKYQYGEETPLETQKRVAKALASVEKNPDEWEEKFLNILVKFDQNNNASGLKSTLGGRITANLGTSFKKATLFNCFISGPIKNAELKYKREYEGGGYDVNITTDDTPDDLYNIFLVILEQAKTLASEGGYGINFDFIRPRGSIIKGTGIKHPGVVAYMKIWDSVSQCIVQGDEDGYKDKIKNYLNNEQLEELEQIIKKMSRKGAMMGCLSIWHPDCEEFIRAKQQSGVLTKFNVSVVIDDVFMKAVSKDGYYEQYFNGKVYKKIKARDLYELIMLSTYNRGEPGVLFYDNMNRKNPISYLGLTKTTNPCVAKGTYVSTKNGLKKVEDVKIGEEIQTTIGFGKVKSIETHEEQDIYRVYFSDGFHIDVTEGHIFYTQKHNGESRKRWDNTKRLSELKVDEHWVKKEYYKFEPKFTNNTRDEGLLLGLYFGDGCYTNYNSFNISVNSQENNQYIIDLYERFGFGYRIDKSEGNGERIYAINAKTKLDSLWKEFEIDPNNKFNFKIENFINTNKNFISGLIDGLLSSDGNVLLKSRYPLVRFKNISTQLHNLLNHLFLVVGADYHLYLCGKKGEVTNIYGREVVRQSDIYEGVITNDSIVNMFNYIGYISHLKKNEDIKHMIKFTSLNGCKWKSKITDIKHIGKSTVYDLYEESADDWNTHGYVNRGCGEVPGLDTITTVCLLGSINLTMYVKANRTFDWELYENDIKIFSRMLDNVNDLAYLPLPSYQWAVENVRQYGMGINGLGSTLIMLGYRYGDKKSLNFCKRVFETKENLTWQSSALLAKEKGIFPLYDKEKFTSTEYYNSGILWQETKDLIEKYGVRNAKTTTNPPLGNSSVICDNISNGIEPIFSLKTERKRIVDKWPEGLTQDNVKQKLKKTQENDYVYWRGEYEGKEYYYEPHNRGLCEIGVERDFGCQWLIENGYDLNGEEIVSTKDLNIDNHLKVQELAQRYCNQAISKTSNLPKDYPFDDFKRLYMEAWKLGLIGFTTYREGSMESVLEDINKAEEKKEIIKKDIKLPDSFINGPTTVIKREGMKFYIHFSYLPEDSKMSFPIAMWIYTNSTGEARACNKACNALKKLALECGVDLDIVEFSWEKTKNDQPHNKLAKMISLNLRHNVSSEDILSALSGIEGDNISTLLTSVRKFIGNCIKEGTLLSKLKCLNCGSSSMKMESGCAVCLDCGFSGCG